MKLETDKKPQDKVGNNAGRSVLLVGGSGYIGTVITSYLLDAGYHVRVLDRLIYDNQTCVPIFLKHPDFEFRFGDIADRETFRSALEEITDVVFLAGLVGDPITKKYPVESEFINETGYERAFAVLDDFELDKVVFVSTCSNYGLIPEGDLAVEEYELSPLSSYSVAKVKAEQALLALKGNVRYSPVVLRFATAFGLSPRMRFDLTINEFTREMFFGNELVVYDPDTWRPYCHVNDFANVIDLVLSAPASDTAFKFFNAGGDTNNYTKRMVVEAIRAHLPMAPVKYQERGSDPRNYRVDFSKIRNTLGFTPAFDVDAGIRELIVALESGIFHQIDMPPKFFGNYEIDYAAPGVQPGK
jgi:nucleoside-diphosphate-sugar epimerase